MTESESQTKIVLGGDKTKLVQVSLHDKLSGVQNPYIQALLIFQKIVSVLTLGDVLKTYILSL